MKILKQIIFNKIKKQAFNLFFLMAPGHGFEPRLDDPESPVLPLDDPGKCTNIILSPEKNWSIIKTQLI